jgi:hypothetical protein
VYHFELRQFPGQVRRFNLAREELERALLDPWRRGEAIVLDEQRFSPEKAKLRVLEGPELHPSEIGLGRGWQNAQRAGREVTGELLAPAGASTGAAGGDALAALKSDVLAACALEPRPLADMLALASQRRRGARASERLALAERAAWELLHEGRLELLDGDGDPVASERWQELMLAWESWGGPPGHTPLISATRAR